MAEISERSRIVVYGDEKVELSSFDSNGVMWLNVGDVCLFRAKKTVSLFLDECDITFISTNVPMAE